MKIKKFNYSKTQAFLVVIFSVFVVGFSLILSYKVYNFIKVIPVSSIIVKGASANVRNELMEDLAFIEGQKVMAVNLENLRDYLNSLPWIYHASVSRNLSGEIIINLIEVNPYFLWMNDEGNYKLINADDTISGVKLNFPLEDLITIEKGKAALDSSHELRFLIYQDLDILKEIKSLKYNGYRWDIVLKNGLVIRLPEVDAAKAYAVFLAMNKKYNFLDKNLEYIDATPTNKLFIKPNGG
ncbi:MAG: FtsQ-type POTRA domain-containing protein [Alphaproteobacteria bacterium]|nr:FtsQ-type POTRA domain-containing protein [Alphaproteobacteria bacterium]